MAPGWWFSEKKNELVEMISKKFYKGWSSPNKSYIDEMSETFKDKEEDVNAMYRLLVKQQEKFQGILTELEKYEEKIGHWAWYVWPTSQPGRSEREPKTWIAPYLIPALLENTDLENWTNILEKINELIGKYGWHVIPDIDYGRIQFFVVEFDTEDKFLRDLYPDFYKQIDVLRGHLQTLKSPRGIILDRFTATNTNSDFLYGYGRYTIYVDIDGDDISIIAITRGPFKDRIGLPDIVDDMKARMVKDINRRLKKRDMSVMKKKVFRNLRNEIRKTIVS